MVGFIMTILNLWYWGMIIKVIVDFGWLVGYQ